MPKMPLEKKFYCEMCDFTCSKKSNWNAHLLTTKHEKNVVFFNTSNTSKIRQHVWRCECGKEFKHRGSLYNHKKKCRQIIKVAEEKKIESDEEITVKRNDDPSYKELLIQAMKEMTEMRKENTEMRKENTEMRKQMTDMIPLIGNNNTTNNNTTNNNFNLNLFLNETCKDALNLTDFINSLQVQLQDLEYTADNGHIKGITNIFHNALSNLEVTKRPMHCTDLKREVLYIKDNNEWHKDDDKEEIKVAVNKVVNKNIGNQGKWIDAHPNLEREEEMENYIRMQDHSLGTGEEIEQKKIIKNILKEVVIEKENKS
jgi:hypothetical protein